MDSPLVTQTRPGVTRVRFDRPEAGNALDLDAARALLSAIETAEADPHMAVLTLTGSGRVFCGGGDVAAMAQHRGADRPAFLRELAEAAHRVMLALARSRLVVLAAVNGAAAGAGLGLVLNSDLVIAAENAKFVAAYSAIGLTPDSGVSRLLPHVVGHQRAMELLVGSRTVGAKEAEDWSLVNAVVPASDLEGTTTLWEDRLLRVPAHALAETKRLARLAGDPELGLEDHLERETESIVRASETPEAGARIEQFAQKG